MDELKSDPVLAELVEEFGELELTPAENEFERLVISIISQSVSTASARAIRERVFDLLPEVTPEAVLNTDEDALIDAGLGQTKTGYIQNVARAFQERELTRKALADETNEEVIDELTQIRGVGEWTAQIYLMFALGREDVFPIGDLGVRRGMESLYGELSREEMHDVADQWRPYRSIGTLYIWEYYES